MSMFAGVRTPRASGNYVGCQVQVAKRDANEGSIKLLKKRPAAHSQLSPAVFCPIDEFDRQLFELRGQPDPRPFIVGPFADRDAIALVRRRPVDPPRQMPDAKVGWRLELDSEGPPHSQFTTGLIGCPGSVGRFHSARIDSGRPQ
jgi:hypothetical protein